MNRLLPTCCATILAVAIAAPALAQADKSTQPKQPAPPAPKAPATPAPPAAPKAPAAPAQPATPPGTPAGMPPEMMKMMEAWEKAAAVGEEHKMLANMAGTWNGEVEFWMMPEMPSSKMSGVMVSTAELGGRWIRQQWDGMMEGQPFQGVGYFGYDNTRKTFVSTWMDNMSTGMMVAEGTYDPSTKTFTLHAEQTNPVTGKQEKVREVVKVISNDEHVMEMYGPDMRTGKEFMNMRITYKRKK